MTRHDQDFDLAASLREVAHTTPEPPWDGLEQRLMAAFDARRQSAVDSVTAAPRSALRPRWWQAAAAVLVIAGAIIWYPVPDGPPAPKPKPADAPRPNLPATPAPAAIAPPAATAASVFSTTPPPSATPPHAAGRDGVFDFADFVALPGASALPDFESGRIVRVELPLAMLPAYGLDMVPDAMPYAIEADLLVGQDGHPRAIRLASDASHHQE